MTIIRVNRSEPCGSSQFVGDIHRLRGIAIALVVANHCLSFFAWDEHPISHRAALDLFDDSTVIFMFISGYLFQHTSTSFSYLVYLRKKLLNVVAPYALAAVPGIAYAVLRAQPAFFDRLGLTDASLLTRVAYLYVYGGSQVNYALWFVPVVCIYFAIAPALIQISRRPALYAALGPLLLLSLLMHRPTYSHGHNVGLAVYFLFPFVGGMFCCQFREIVSPPGLHTEE